MIHLAHTQNCIARVLLQQIYSSHRLICFVAHATYVTLYSPELMLRLKRYDYGPKNVFTVYFEIFNRYDVHYLKNIYF